VTASPSAPSADGWRRRAGAAGAARELDRSPVLAASEIASFAFCPQAWYLQRRRLRVTPQADRRRRAGMAAHRALGRRTDALGVAALARRLLLVVIALLLVVVLFVLFPAVRPPAGVP
jgi:hypothetical protein